MRLELITSNETEFTIPRFNQINQTFQKTNKIFTKRKTKSKIRNHLRNKQRCIKITIQRQQNVNKKQQLQIQSDVGQ